MNILSKNRASLLRIFYTNPDESYYMHELGRMIGKKPGNFQRVINNMETEGVLVSERRANARYFKANKDHPLYEELRNIVFKTIGVAGSLKDVLERVGNIDIAFIYGSYAKGAENQLSDIDLIIIGKCDEDVLVREIDHLEEGLKREINFKLFTPEEFKNNVREKEPFLTNILADKKIMLKGGDDGLRKILE